VAVAAQTSRFTHNAFLSKYWDPNVNHWMRFYPYYQWGRDRYVGIARNYWGTTSTTLIDAAIIDFNDDFNKAHIVYQPILSSPAETTYPFVWKVELSTVGQSGMSALNGPTPLVSAEPVTFTVTFNRDMDTSVQPAVSFGPDVPNTDYTIHPVNGGWQDPRTWVGTHNVTPITGDGYQLMRIAGPARAADDPWLVIGDDVERFRFEIITSGTESMNLQATGGEGYVDLSWTQDDFDLLSGFNLYRSTTQDGTYSRINSSIIPPDQRVWRDTAVAPGQPYFYKFTIVKSDMSESDYSNVATATPLDTIPPAISHTPVTTAAPGLALTIYADVTDNVGVQGVTLYYRQVGATTFTGKAMVKTTGDRYSATIEGAKITSPGLEYYIEATDGISTVRSGRPEYPHQVVVVDRPVITSVTPDHGLAEGGTAVTIAGSNFKAGASVTFGGAVCEGVAVVSASQITCVTPAHFPAAVDVVVTNLDGQSGTKLRGFTFESSTVSLSLPNTGGGQHAVVQVPINAANVQGLAAASLTIAFDNSVIQAVGAHTGALTPGWSLVANTATAGQARLSMASNGGTVSGSGILAMIEFDVVGTPGQSSALGLSNVSLNGGAIPVETANGTFSVDVVYSVSGHVNFWNGGVVSDTLLTLQGDRLYAGQSGGDGAYTVAGAAAGDYTLTPSKSDDVNGISAFDASYALQHDAGLITLSGYAATAGDVDKSGVIDSMDAFYILQKSVNLIALPFPGAGVVWDFAPSTRTYAGLSSNQSGQDFAAVLLGDITGNWSPTGLASVMAMTDADAPTLSLAPGRADAHGDVVATLRLDPGRTSVRSLDLSLAYDPVLATAVAVTLGPQADGALIQANLGEPGRIRLALAGALPLAPGSDEGDLLVLRFHLADPAAAPPLALQQAAVNETATTLNWQVRPIRIYGYYLPMVGRDE